MVTDIELQRWTQSIVEQFHPLRVILFGSYATEHAHAESDIDILVVMSYQERSFKMAAKIRRVLRNAVGYVGALDVMVRSPEEINHRLALGDSFIRDIVTQGKVLYDADHRNP